MTADVAHGNAMDRMCDETRKLTPSEVYAATFTRTGNGSSGGRRGQGSGDSGGGDGGGLPGGRTRRVVDESSQARRISRSSFFSNQPLSLEPQVTHSVPVARMGH